MKTSLVICAGGSGSKAAEYFFHRGLPEVAGWQLELLVLDTPVGLIKSEGRNRLRVLRSSKHGCMSLDQLHERITTADSIILVGSMAGNTGRLLLPFLATMARACALPVSAFLLLPFRFEGKVRYERAVQGNALMQLLTDRIELLDNENLLNDLPSATLLSKFEQQFRAIGERCIMWLREMDYATH
jgi:cell division GTPase FtsZ